MRLEHIKFLEEISKVNSLNYASNNLCISVQALSVSIKKLEEELGFKILDSDYCGTALTPKGTSLLEAGIEFTKKIREIQGGDEAMFGNMPEYDVYTVFGMIEVLFPSFIIEFKRLYPNSNINLNSLKYYEIMEGLLNKCYDYALIFNINANGKQFIIWDDRFEFTPLKDLKIYCCVNKKMPLANKKTVSMKTLLKYNVICWQPEITDQMNVEKIVKSFSPEKEVIKEKHHSIFNKRLVTTDIVTITCCINDEFIENLDALNYIPIEDDININIGYLTVKNPHLSDISQEFINLLHNFFKSR